MPGSGWSILSQEKRVIEIDGDPVNIGRFEIGMGESRMLMDFWYITRFGETANDYVFKLYAMAGALTFKPNDVVFIRILARNSEQGKAALDEFEKLYVSEVYDHLGF